MNTKGEIDSLFLFPETSLVLGYSQHGRTDDDDLIKNLFFCLLGSYYYFC